MTEITGHNRTMLSYKGGTVTPACECGWIGKPWPESRDAMGEATEHRRDAKDRWYVIVCRHCWPAATREALVGDMPFRSAKARGKWASEHGKAHAPLQPSWFVVDV